MSAPSEKLVIVTIDEGGSVGTPSRDAAAHFQLAAFAPNGLPTMGFALTITDYLLGEEVAAPDGFEITPYRLLYPTGEWLKWATREDVTYRQALVCYDVGGGAALYFNVTGEPGQIVLALTELP
jgi:hypothetical protein